jgi:uncharacterized repeat protein (TIGR01451 family)
MFNQRTARSATRRLRVDILETREVPDAGVPDVDPLPPDDTIPVQLPPPSDPKPVDPATDPVQTDGNLEDPDVIFQTTSTPQVPPVDLVTTMTVDRLKPSVGDVVVLKVTLANASQIQATGAKATLTLPAGMTFVSSDSPDKYDAATGAWTPGTIAALGKAVLLVKAKVTDAAEQAVTAAVAGADQPDPKAENNSAAVKLTPVLGRLNVATSFSQAAVNVGSTVLMTVAVGNGGPGRARDVVVTNTLPEGVTFIKALSATQGNYNATTHTWTVGMVAPGTIPVLRLMVLVNKAGKLETGTTATGTGFDATQSRLDVTGAITGVKSTSPATWAYFSGFGFQTGPGPVPRAAAPWSGAQITTQFLVTHGFKLNGTKLI